MMDFRHRYVAQATYGEGVYVQERGIVYAPSVRPRGLAEISNYDAGKRYFYRVSRCEAGAFRRWAEYAFLANDGRNRLAGRFPSYEVVNKPGA